MDTTFEDWQRYLDWKEISDSIPTGMPDMPLSPQDVLHFPAGPFGLEGIPEVEENAPVPDLELDTFEGPFSSLCLPQMDRGLDLGRSNQDSEEILRRLDDISARLSRLESTVTTTANDMERVMHTARGALQNLIDLADGFYDSIEKLKTCMGLFTKGLVEHFFGDDATLEVEM
ncbi:hypothetical protein Landi51_13134 [Colletotrichum acutatum]